MIHGFDTVSQCIFEDQVIGGKPRRPLVVDAHLRREHETAPRCV